MYAASFRFRLLRLLALVLPAAAVPATAQPIVEVRPAMARFDPSGPAQQTFVVYIKNYVALSGYSVPLFFDPSVVRLVSYGRSGELISAGGGTPFCLTSNAAGSPPGFLQMNCSTLGGGGTSAAEGVAFSFTLERVAEGTSGLIVHEDFYGYNQSLRLRAAGNVPILAYSVVNGAVAVARPLPEAAFMRTFLDISATERDSAETAFAPMASTGVLHRVRDNGTGGQLTAARYDTRPPGGDNAPFTDPDHTVMTFGTVPRYWEITSTFGGAHAQDLSFSYAGLSIFDPSRLRLARRALANDGTVAWTLYPAAKTTVNTTAHTVTLVSTAPGDVATGQYALVGEASALPVELVAFAAAADGSTARLTWTTASETNNAGFYVEQHTAAGWTDAGFVAGRGTTQERVDYAYRVEHLTPGRHAFRLRQVDTDGTLAHSATVEVSIGLDEPYRVVLRGANPVRGRFDASVFVAQRQGLRLSLVDAAGREAAVLFDGPAEAGAAVPVSADASALASGLYWLRGVGEHVRFARPVVVAR